jgi:type IV secretory pathway VirB4 component
VRLHKMRVSTAEWSTVWPWQHAPAVPLAGPVVGVENTAGGAPFGLDPFVWHERGYVSNPNVVISGAPGYGKSALVKAMLWWLVGVSGYRMAVTDVKGEYRLLADALGVPVVDLYPGGPTRINPLDDPAGRVEFVGSLAGLCLQRPLTVADRAVIGASLNALPARPVLSDLMGVWRDIPERVTAELDVSRGEAAEMVRDLRYGFGELLSGPYAGMFDGPTTVSLDTPRGFVTDISRCGRDPRLAEFALSVGIRTTRQLVTSRPGRTLIVSDESWKAAKYRSVVNDLQSNLKLGRSEGIANILLMHRMAELGLQSDGRTGDIADTLISDSDTRIAFHQGDDRDLAVCAARLQLPDSSVAELAKLAKHQFVFQAGERRGVVTTVLSPRLAELTFTDQAMRQEKFAAAAAA